MHSSDSGRRPRLPGAALTAKGRRPTGGFRRGPLPSPSSNSGGTRGRFGRALPPLRWRATGPDLPWRSLPPRARVDSRDLLVLVRVLSVNNGSRTVDSEVASRGSTYPGRMKTDPDTMGGVERAWEPEDVEPLSPGSRAAAALVFDDPLGRPSAEDTDRGWGEASRSSAEDDTARFLSEKPPHHI